MTLCVAHRGGSALAPENTLAAFEAGIAAGADWVECDVHLSRDEALVVIHDADLRRTTDAKGQVGALTLAEIQRADAAARFAGRWPVVERIPTLADVLRLIAGRAGVQVEIKVLDGRPYPGIERRVVAELVVHGPLADCLVMSFDSSTLERVREASGEARTALLIGADHEPRGGGPLWRRVSSAAASCGARVVGLDVRLVSAPLVTALQQTDLAVAAWTANDEATMRHCRALDLEAITSDRPDLLRRILDGAR